MSAPLSPIGNTELPRRPRLVRDGVRSVEASTVDHFALAPGEMYRISYSVGGAAQRRVTRSVVIFAGQSERRVWGGETMACLDFSLPQGRSLSLLTAQLVDARPAEMNERGQWVLQQPGGRRRRAARRQYGRGD